MRQVIHNMHASVLIHLKQLTVKLQTINFENRVLLIRTNVKKCDQSLVTITDVSSTFFKGAKITL